VVRAGSNRRPSAFQVNDAMRCADLRKRMSLTTGTALGGRCNVHASRTGREVRVGLAAEVTRKRAWQSMANRAAIRHSATLTADRAGRLRLALSQEPSVTRPRQAAKMSRLTRPYN
jgi:hypothetical protein